MQTNWKSFVHVIKIMSFSYKYNRNIKAATSLFVICVMSNFESSEKCEMRPTRATVLHEKLDESFEKFETKNVGT
jgi:hypothetical protein